MSHVSKRTVSVNFLLKSWHSSSFNSFFFKKVLKVFCVFSSYIFKKKKNRNQPNDAWVTEDTCLSKSGIVFIEQTSQMKRKSRWRLQTAAVQLGASIVSL